MKVYILIALLIGATFATNATSNSTNKTNSSSSSYSSYYSTYSSNYDECSAYGGNAYCRSYWSNSAYCCVETTYPGGGGTSYDCEELNAAESALGSLSSDIGSSSLNYQCMSGSVYIAASAAISALVGLFFL